MKSVHFIDKFFPEYSGTSTRTYNLLSRIPDDSLLITPDTKVDGTKIPSKEDFYGNIKVKRVSLEPTNFWRFAPLRYVHTVNFRSKIMIDAARSEKYDVIHGHEISLIGKAAQKLSKISKKPLIIELHIAESHFPDKLSAFYEFYLLKISRIFESCDCVITLTNAFKDHISEIHDLDKEKIKVVPNGVDIDTFKPQESYVNKLTNLKQELGINDKLVMYSGYMDKINGIVDFVETIPSLIDENPDISYLFIGSGPEKEGVISASKKYDQVKYLPMVNYEDMPLYYQLCDVFVIPRPYSFSSEIIAPLKLLEAMSMEKIVLGSDVGGIAEVIEEGKNGYLFKKGDMVDFKEVLLKIIDSDSDKIGKNARKTIMNDYTWDKSANILQNIYEDVVQH